uniref:Uncharacterized protein n=1 Tax=Gossypium raimondii TaxID=29730 RepID=A0A0D2TGC2_GOSRA|nr:hypothetical protein B456_009G087000 [Gossypium raimondii]
MQSLFTDYRVDNIPCPHQMHLNSIGAEHVRLACVDLMQACEQMQKQKFLLALDWTKTEFTQTQNKLQVLVQMERRIMRLEAKQKN